VTVEDLMKERGQLVKKGTLGEDGDLEFWEDGSVTERNADSGEQLVKEAKDRKEEEEEGKESWRENAPGSTFKDRKE
jgi:protein import protein ZIM17